MKRLDTKLKLKVKLFYGTRDAALRPATQCCEFIENNRIEREDILQIVHDDHNVFLYYWKEE